MAWGLRTTRPAVPNILSREQSLLLVVDVQEKLFPAMDSELRDSVAKNLKVLGASARRLNLPLLLSEQYPKGLGHTLPELQEALGRVSPVEKVAFSCCDAPSFTEQLKAARRSQVVLAGIEAHVCVLMTGLDLLNLGYQVHVVADATCSRSRQNWQLGLQQLRQAGVVVTSTESVIFQLLRRADTDEFRAIQAMIK
ncbi:MAG TPA: hydrolase [Methylomirabilota bacterium]|nr:hydrolase [Methylomirabilota bacterium]